MKTRALFVSMLAIAALTGCNNEDNPIDNRPVEGEKTIQLTLNMPSVQTRAIDDPISAGTYAQFTNATLYFKEKADAVAVPLTLNTEQIGKLNAATGTPATIIVNVKKSMTLVSLKGNTTSDPDIKTMQFTNKTTFQKGVPMTAPEVAITDASGGTTGTATLVPVPDLARIEVLGKITPVGTNTWESVTVKAVYINNYYPTSGGTLWYKGQMSSTNWDNAYTSTGGYNLMADLTVTTEDYAAMGNSTKAAAHQIYPTNNSSDIIHVILKMVIKKKDQAAVSDRFFTITQYKKSTTGDFTKFEKGNIYKLNISGLGDKFKDDGTDPTDPEPEMGKKDVTITVNAYPWAVTNITPDI